MNNIYKSAIVQVLYKDAKKGGGGIKEPALFAVFKQMKSRSDEIRKTLILMRRDNIITFTKGVYRLKNISMFFEGEVTKVNKTCGFVMNENNNTECFVRGRDLIGAMPKDRIIGKITELSDESGENSDTAIVLAITQEAENGYSGTITADERGVLYVVPDSFTASPLRIVRWNGNKIQNHDKVRFRIHQRGERHSEHTADIISIYGNAEHARVNVLAYLEDKGIEKEFPFDVIDEAKRISNKGISEAELKNRLDLRDLPIFTIDGADTKDIDDAISISRNGNGYKLGVHIADVSHYVKMGNPLDNDAFSRGTSVYIADMVIPMLPKELSNGICSLNPNADRLAFSCLMDISAEGIIDAFTFRKTVIRSRVQGVYREVNAIISEEADDAIKEKYKEVIASVPLMKELAAILTENRKKRGAPEIETQESKIICNIDGVCVDIKLRERGISEGIIEEFMLAANNCAAKLAMKQDFPFVYRVHEPPTAEKLQNLSEMLVILGCNNLGINEEATAKDLAAVLESVKEDKRAAVINQLVLRTMMKAKYSELPLGHFGLVMKEYAHFTSPIRRYADLSIHRILSDYLRDKDTDKLKKKYTKFSEKASLRASQTEITAVNAERDCDKFYMAEFMQDKIGEKFAGIISGVAQSGIFVRLENTVEGRISTDLLPEGEYQTENNVAMVDTLSGIRFSVGDEINVVCAGVNVSMGTIDFSPVK